MVLNQSTLNYRTKTLINTFITFDFITLTVIPQRKVANIKNWGFAKKFVLVILVLSLSGLWPTYGRCANLWPLFQWSVHFEAYCTELLHSAWVQFPPVSQMWFKWTYMLCWLIKAHFIWLISWSKLITLLWSSFQADYPLAASTQEGTEWLVGDMPLIPGASSHKPSALKRPIYVFHD